MSRDNLSDDSLVNKDISFRLTNNGKVLFSTNRKSENLKM